MLQRTLRGRGTAAVFGVYVGLVTLVGFERVEASPKPCLPPPDCKNSKACCAKPQPESCVFAMGLSEASAERDWYADKANQKAASDKTNVGGNSAAGHDAAAAAALYDAFQSFAKDKLGPEEQKKLKKSCPGSMNVMSVGWQTNKETCAVSADPGLNDQDTCQEFIDAAKLHEQEHSDICEVFKHNYGQTPDALAAQRALQARLAAQMGGDPSTLAGSAEDERRAYAREAAYLRKQRDRARARCTFMKKKEKEAYDTAMSHLGSLDAQASAAGAGGGK